MKQTENIYEYRKLSKNRNDGVVAYNNTCWTYCTTSKLHLIEAFIISRFEQIIPISNLNYTVRENKQISPNNNIFLHHQHSYSRVLGSV